MFRSRREAFKSLNEVLGDQRAWPVAIRYAIHKKHMSNQDRFKVIVFLLCNGVSPTWILAFFQAVGNYDQAAYRQINWIIVHYPHKNWKAWNLTLRRSV